MGENKGVHVKYDGYQWCPAAWKKQVVEKRKDGVDQEGVC